MVTQGLTEVEIATKLGVDDTTISKDIKALKLISQQFIYDITKSDFTYYYKQCLDAVKLILRKQYEIVDKERITKEDVWRAKVLADMLNTVSTINDYYKAAPEIHQTPMQRVLSEERFGVRPGTKHGGTQNDSRGRTTVVKGLGRGSGCRRSRIKDIRREIQQPSIRATIL